MRLQDNPYLPADTPLARQLTALWRPLVTQLNGLSEGRMAARYAARMSAPTTGEWAQGDYVHNSAPTVAGVAGSQYVVMGWVCTDSGEPGTWVECRSLTGT